MVRSWIIAELAAVTMVVTRCAQGAGNAPPGATEHTTSQGWTRGQETNSSSASGNGLVCRGGMMVGGIVDYAARAKGEKGSTAELARRDFSKKIKEGDKVVAERSRNTSTVRVVRDGRVVAIIEYRRAGGGWLRDSYRACSGF